MIFGRKSGSARGFGWAPEVMVITAAAPVLGSLVNPADPYLLHGPFPWLVLAPLAVALMHGLWAGLTSSAVLIGLAGWQAMSTGTLPASFASWSIGCTLTALIAGQIRDSVRGRTDKLAVRAEQLQDRLERSERTRHLIQLSHAKLEERVVASRSSLASAIDDAERRMADGQSMHDLAQALLDVLATQGHLHAATLYVAAREQGMLLSDPVATFGGTGASSAQHALVVRAFKTGKLAAVVEAVEAARNDTSVLAAVPLITAARRTVGVVAVHQMPFMMFHADHLNQVFALAGHLADLLFDRWTEVHGDVQLARDTESDELGSARRSVTVQSVLVDPSVYQAAALAAPTPLALTSDAGPSAAAGLDNEIPIEIEDDSPEGAERAEIEASVTARVAANVVGVFERGSVVASETFEPAAAAPVAIGAVVLVRTQVVPAVEVTRTEEVVQTVEVIRTEEVVQTVEAISAVDVVQAVETTPAVAAGHALEAVDAPEAVPSVEAAPAATAAPAASALTVEGVRQRARAATTRKSRKRPRVAPAPAGFEPATAATPASEPAAVAPVTNLEASVAPAAAPDRALKLEDILHNASTTQNVSTTAVAPVTRDEATPTPAPETRETTRTILPPPVENARTAILAAFARKANSDVGVTVVARPAAAASFRFARAATSGRRSSTATSAAPVRTFGSSRAPLNTEVTETQTALPAKAQDARASVRAAFQKARSTPLLAEQSSDDVRSLAASSSVPVTADSSSQVAPTSAAFKQARALPATQIVDSRHVTQAAVAEARAAMLATLAKARGITPKLRSSHRGAPVSEAASVAPDAAAQVTRSESVATFMTANRSFAPDQALAQLANVRTAAPRVRTKTLEMPAVRVTSSSEANAADSGAPDRRETVAAPTSNDEAAPGPEHTTAREYFTIERRSDLPVEDRRSAAPAAKTLSPERAAALPPPPAPVGLAGLGSLAQPAAEPRSRMQPTRPSNGAATRSSSSL